MRRNLDIQHDVNVARDVRDIRQALNQGTRMSDKIDISKLLPKISQLPVLPSAIAEILRVVNDPGASGPDIEWAVSRDQAVSAKVLKIVNSAAYGFSRKIETVRDASVMLGMRQVRDIAASMAVADLFSGDSTGLVQGPRLWIHGLACSIWAREILSLKRLNGMDYVVTAALLHDSSSILRGTVSSGT